MRTWVPERLARASRRISPVIGAAGGPLPLAPRELPAADVLQGQLQRRGTARQPELLLAGLTAQVDAGFGVHPPLDVVRSPAGVLEGSHELGVRESRLEVGGAEHAAHDLGVVLLLLRD